MGRIHNYIVFLSSCLSGGFDENPQLEELEEALKTAPKIESLKINGTEVERNTESRRVINAKVGDVLSKVVAGGDGRYH